MNSNKYTNTVLTVIAVCLVMILIRLSGPETAIADLQGEETRVFVTNGDYPYELRVEITNVLELAHEIYLWKDGVPDYLADPPDLSE